MMDNNILLDEIHKDNRTAEEKIIANNMGLVTGLSKRFFNRGYDAEDIIQIGCIGLMKAARKFDRNYNVCFSTYAVPLILGEIKKFLRDDGIIKVSRTHKTNAQKIKIAEEKLFKLYNRAPTFSEISKESGLSNEEILSALSATAPVQSIYQQTDEDDKRYAIDKMIMDNTESKVINKILVKESIDILNKKEREVIVMRYFQGITQTKISELIGVSQVQVSRIEKKALQKMKMFLEE